MITERNMPPALKTQSIPAPAATATASDPAKKTVLISVPYGMSARNVLRSTIFEQIKRNHNAVIVSPLGRDESFCEEFGGEAVSIEFLPKPLTWFYKIYRGILDIAEGYFFSRRSGFRSFRILEDELRKRSPWLYFSKILCGRLLTLSRSFFEFLREFQIRLTRQSFYDDLFQKHQPSVIFSTHPFALEEMLLLFNAKRWNIPIVSFIHSWDNVSSKSGLALAVNIKRSGRMLPFKFQKIIVWNEILKNELVQYYDYDPKDVYVSGIPQFDSYQKREFHSKTDFFKTIGADPDKKLITFFCGNERFHPTQIEILRFLVKAIESGQFRNDGQLLIRSHPGIPIKHFEEKMRSDKVLFNMPGIASSAKEFYAGWKSDETDEKFVPELIYHSDVVLNIFSTTSIECALLDRPNICIAFDGNLQLPYDRSVRRFYDFTHFAPVMESRAAKVALSYDQLILFMNEYLSNPNLDAQNRRQLVEKMCHPFDGQAGFRIGNYLSEFLES